MQRPAYSVPPAHSPPLHHPVPQHVSTVPHLRSPPPPVGSAQSRQGAAYGYGQDPSQAASASNNYMQPAFTGFMNDPTAQLGFQMGKSAVDAGQQYAEQTFNRFVSISALKHYFNVSNRYVLSKLTIVLFPWRHRPWSRQQARSNDGQGSMEFLPPREDVNSPDMYIPLMAFVTYILLSTLIAGLNGKFKPELLGITFSNASVIIVLELLLLWLGRYFLNISSESQIYDLIAYSGYKFVGVIVTIAVAAIVNRGQGTGGWVGWTVFAYTFMANAFFLLRSLKYVLLPSDDGPGNSGMQPIARSQRSRRTQFLFVYSYVVQFAFMWWLSALDVGGAKA
ncbi:probable membrane protein [Ramularia collo-cygni]|uniref:Protein YIF1 n=1 Tax=Ramularia collo-cygni TaxID=112498 RepID=A0A2D3V5M9_9PEZI|nr:probable membrane protein [Ramularia collo-cygni]CZT15593.1 probable membrane protein [Ramularia collo-cygni]